MKKFGKLLICLSLASSIAFTGCSLVQRNTDRYLNRTVASAGEITVSKQELVSAYNSYGYQYVQYYGYTAERAVKTVLDSLINRKIMLEKAKEVIKETNDGEMAYYNGETKVATVSAKNVWQNEVWQETFDSVNEQIKDIEEKVKKERNIASSSEETEDETTPEFDSFKEYEKKVLYEDGNWSKIAESLKPAEDNTLGIGDFTQDATGDEKVSSIAFKRYIKQLTNSYKNLNLSISSLKLVLQSDFDALYSGLNLTTTEKIAFLYELERIHTSHDESKYITEYEDVYENYIQTINDSFNQKVVNYYKQLVEASYETYEQETFDDSYSKYVSAMQDDPSKIYYHRDYGVNQNGEKRAFVAVSHVLIKLSDDQISEIEDLKTKLSTGVIGQEEYDDSYQKILDKTVVHARDDEGNETEITKTVAEVRAEIYSDLEQYSTVEEKAVAFNKYIYKYGQDTGMINAEHYYAVNLDTTQTDKMVKEFADESRRLSVENEDGGNLSQPIFVSQSNYSGYHIIFNAGLFKNDLTIEQVRNLDYSDADYLYNKKLMLGTNKTVYDYIYDTIYSSDWSNYQNSILNTAKNNLKVVYYVSAYEDLY